MSMVFAIFNLGNMRECLLNVHALAIRPRLLIKLFDGTVADQ